VNKPGKFAVTQEVVTPVKTGVQKKCNRLISLDSGFRRNDENVLLLTCCENIKLDTFRPGE